jgi:hypothetical protein
VVKHDPAPSSGGGGGFQPFGETSFDERMRGVARAVVPPVANFLDYAPRAIAADIYGVTHGALPIGEEGRKKFYEVRDKSLEATKIPETKGGETISKVLGFPGEMIGTGIQEASKAVLGRETTTALGPLATIAGDVFPAARAAKAALTSPTAPNIRPAVLNARNAGYVLPPSMISDTPGILTNLMAGHGGQLLTEKAASGRNQIVSDRLAKSALGLPDAANLDETTFRNIRNQAGQNYAAVSRATPTVVLDNEWFNDVNGILSAKSQVQEMFPKITKNPHIEELVANLKEHPEVPTPVALELVKTLRQQANENFKALGDPHKIGLGVAQRQAADFMDGLIDRNVSADVPVRPANTTRYYRAGNNLTSDEAVARARSPSGLEYVDIPTGRAKTISRGKTEFPAPVGIDRDLRPFTTGMSSPERRALVDNYRQARQLIARSYDVEGATNPATGHVSAGHLAQLADKGRPLSGGLDTIANTALAFKKAMRSPDEVGHVQPFSGLDVMYMAGMAATGRLEAAALALARPISRATMLSERHQEKLVRGGTGPSYVASTLIQPHGDIYKTPANSALGVQ